MGLYRPVLFTDNFCTIQYCLVSCHLVESMKFVEKVPIKLQ